MGPPHEGGQPTGFADDTSRVNVNYQEALEKTHDSRDVALMIRIPLVN
jgi:hypothetical protein